MKNIDDRVDLALHKAKSEAGEVRPKQKGRHNRTLFGIPIGLATLLVAGMVTASLLFVGTYYVSIQETIDLEGVTDLIVYYDGVGLEVENTVVVATDIPTGIMNPGDTVQVAHTVENKATLDILPRDITFDIDDMILAIGDFITDPSNEYFGFYFSVHEDDTGSPGAIIPFNTPVTIDSGATETFWYCYELDSTYIDGVAPLDFILDMTIEENYGILTANDDSYTFDGSNEAPSNPNHAINMNSVLSNDTQSLEFSFTIDSFTDASWGTVFMDSGNLYWYPDTWVGDPHSGITFTYTIDDGYQQDTATVTIDYLG